MSDTPIDVEIITGILPEPPQEIQEMPDGGSITWNMLCGTGIPLPCKDGTKRTFTLEDIAQMKANLNAGVLGIYPSAYVGHEGRTSGSPALGTVLEAAIVQGEGASEFALYFRARWTAAAVSLIRDGTYKYVSIEAEIHPEHGWVIKAVALTNEPAYRPMAQVAASSIIADNNNPIGGDMNEEILKLIDPGKFLEMLIASPEGSEVLAKFYRDRADKFMPAAPPKDAGAETPPPADKSQTPPQGGEQTPKDRRDEAVATAEADMQKGDKPEGDKGVQASSAIDQAANFFDSEIKKLHGIGVNYPSGLLNQTRSEVLASAYTVGAQKSAEDGLKKLQGFSPSSGGQGPTVLGSSAGSALSPFKKQVERFLKGVQ